MAAGIADDLAVKPIRLKVSCFVYGCLADVFLQKTLFSVLLLLNSCLEKSILRCFRFCKLSKSGDKDGDSLKVVQKTF